MDNEEFEVEFDEVTNIGGAVNSVNGKTGDVELTTDDLENTSGYQTGSEVEDAINQAISEIVARLDGLSLKSISQADYDALTTKDANTLYVITEA